MFHLAAYRSASVTASSVYASLPLIVGSQDWNQNNKFYPPEPMKLIWAAAMSTRLTAARLNQPSMRDIGPHEVYPWNFAANWPSNAPFDDVSDYPIDIKALETVDFQVSVDANAAAACFGLVALKVREDPIPPGRRRRCRFTAAIIAVANAWTLGAISMESDLPAGRYYIMDFGCFSATGVAARLAVQGEPYRPGNIMIDTLGDKWPDNRKVKNWGGFGTFLQQTMPLLEILCTAADTVQEGYLDLIKIG